MAKLDEGDEAQLLDTIDRWIAREVAPVVKEHDHADRWPAEIVEQMKELGLFGATVSAEYGGLGLPATTYAEIVRASRGMMAIIFTISHPMLALAWEVHARANLVAHSPPTIRGGLAHRSPTPARPAGHP